MPFRKTRAEISARAAQRLEHAFPQTRIGIVRRNYAIDWFEDGDEDAKPYVGFLNVEVPGIGTYDFVPTTHPAGISAMTFGEGDQVTVGFQGRGWQNPFVLDFTASMATKPPPTITPNWPMYGQDMGRIRRVSVANPRFKFEDAPYDPIPVVTLISSDQVPAVILPRTDSRYLYVLGYDSDVGFWKLWRQELSLGNPDGEAPDPAVDPVFLCTLADNDQTPVSMLVTDDAIYVPCQSADPMTVAHYVYKFAKTPSSLPIWKYPSYDAKPMGQPFIWTNWKLNEGPHLWVPCYLGTFIQQASDSNYYDFEQYSLLEIKDDDGAQGRPVHTIVWDIEGRLANPWTPPEIWTGVDLYSGTDELFLPIVSGDWLVAKSQNAEQMDGFYLPDFEVKWTRKAWEAGDRFRYKFSPILASRQNMLCYVTEMRKQSATIAFLQTGNFSLIDGSGEGWRDFFQSEIDGTGTNSNMALSFHQSYDAILMTSGESFNSTRYPGDEPILDGKQSYIASYRAALWVLQWERSITYFANPTENDPCGSRAEITYTEPHPPNITQEQKDAGLGKMACEEYVFVTTSYSRDNDDIYEFLANNWVHYFYGNENGPSGDGSGQDMGFFEWEVPCAAFRNVHSRPVSHSTHYLAIAALFRCIEYVDYDQDDYMPWEPAEAMLSPGGKPIFLPRIAPAPSGTNRRAIGRMHSLVADSFQELDVPDFIGYVPRSSGAAGKNAAFFWATPAGEPSWYKLDYQTFALELFDNAPGAVTYGIQTDAMLVRSNPWPALIWQDFGGNILKQL